MNRKKTSYLVLLLLVIPWISGFSQYENSPEPPSFKSYKGIPGKMSKYNNFNYLDIRNIEGTDTKQVMGHYWEISYNYDSVFRQKRKFQAFLLQTINEMHGDIYYQDTAQINFSVPAENGNIWGRAMLNSDKSYRLRIIKEARFDNNLHFDSKPIIIFDKFVDSLALPPRITYLPNSVISRAQYSKFDHQEYTWTVKDTLYRQKVMGPYWDLKVEVRNQKNQVDKQVSSVEILESYYRACVKAGGNIVRNRPRELVFTLPLKGATLWARIMISLDGVYFVRTLIESDQDKISPTKLIAGPLIPLDSLKMNKEKR